MSSLREETTNRTLQRRYTNGQDVYQTVEWEDRDAVMPDYKTGEDAFRQNAVEFPKSWSVNSSNIVTSKYFRGTLGTPEREWSLKEVIDRVTGTIADWGLEEGYFRNGEYNVFRDELKYLLLHQHAAFNSPVWFNIGVEGVPQQSSACFILSVEDNMKSILNWYTEEGIIFKGGSGSGVNLSNIRGSKEGLKGGGIASGPVSFMRGADSSAGAIKSGGKTRRAAKMVVLNVDHPDIEEFIWCKAIEERKQRVLATAGFDMDLDGKDAFSVQYQNANNSVRLTDDFMDTVERAAYWKLTARTTGETVEEVPARRIFRQIAEASWECADPGVQFDTTINKWHTCPNSGPINASNPCSEYVHLDNSACNLASINLLKYLTDDGFDTESFKHTVDVLITAMDILAGRADYPTEKIGDNARRFRQLGLGYANLGALLMAQGLPYDSDGGRAWAASITALMTGEAYHRSAQLAERLGPFDGFATNRDAMLNVLSMHGEAVKNIDRDHVPPALVDQATRSWIDALDNALEYGVRNSQTSVLAPTGTISFMMGCDTTGIEPDFALVKSKKLVGGGNMQIVNQTIPRALTHLGYDEKQTEAIALHILDHGTVAGAPGFASEHEPVFACAVGRNAIHYNGHIKMMGAVQPFLSGAVSKTVNLPEEVTVEDIEQLLFDSWKLGLKAVAIYRDNCKVAQPLSSSKSDGHPEKQTEVETVIVQQPVRQPLPRTRAARTTSFTIGSTRGYLTVGEYDDGRPAELFLRVARAGSSLAGLMDAFAISISHGLQYGVPLKALCKAFVNSRFDPAGMTDDPDVRIANSLTDYMFRRLAIDYLSEQDRAELGILTVKERTQAVNGEAPVPTAPAIKETVLCENCGDIMVRAGSCHACPSCGSTSGCS